MFLLFEASLVFGGPSWFWAKYPGRELMHSSIFHLAWNQGNKMNCQLGQRGRKIWYLLCQRIAWKLMDLWQFPGPLMTEWIPKHPKTIKNLYIHHEQSYDVGRSCLNGLIQVSIQLKSKWCQISTRFVRHIICCVLSSVPCIPILWSLLPNWRPPFVFWETGTIQR